MHSLLKRQLSKHLTDDLVSISSLEGFINAVEKSYENYDEKLSMVNRATAISSEELYAVNQKLREEAERQKSVLFSLEKAINSLSENLDKKEIFGKVNSENITAEALAKHISQLASQVSQMTVEKNLLLKNLEAQNESLNNYAHMVSHDLKSPIRNINALMSWIMEEEKEKFSNSSKENCSLVSQNLERMDKLINGILNHATIGKTAEKTSSFEVKELLEEIVNTIYIPENIEIKYSDKLPLITFERLRLEQLFTNLLLNAITATEHKEKGIIEIDFVKDSKFWQFSISDNGKGIPKKYQKVIFEMFKKLENDENATGIGLALVKKIVNLYEGEIWLDSQENSGTTIHFKLKKNSDGQT